MKTRHALPEVQIGSMADIAFLLLIFFLITTTIAKDSGFDKRLPPKAEVPEVTIKTKNLLEIALNSNNQLMVEDKVTSLSSLKEVVIAFLDNGGVPETKEGFCSYCQGSRRADLSDNPQKAVISLETNGFTEYAQFIAVYDEIIAAYQVLRNREGQRLFGVDYTSLLLEYDQSGFETPSRAQLKERIEVLRELFPQKIVEHIAAGIN